MFAPTRNGFLCRTEFIREFGFHDREQCSLLRATAFYVGPNSFGNSALMIANNVRSYVQRHFM